MKSFFKKFHYKELFLVGFYSSFILITSIAFIIDTMIENYFDALLDIMFVMISALFFYKFIHDKNRVFASRAIFWITSSIVFIFVMHSNFDMSLFFTLLIPIVAFILMNKYEILKNISLYYLILIGMLIYGFNINDEHHFFYNANNMSAYFIATLFVLAFGVFYNYAIERSHYELEKANSEKEVLIKEIHHRIKNNLNIISSILGLQKLEYNSPEIDELIDQNQLRIESISLAHELLYQSQDLEEIDFNYYVYTLGKYLFTSMNAQKIALNIESHNIKFSLDTMSRLGIIINELITNSIKYAFDNDGTIYIALSNKAEGYQLSYHDEGSKDISLFDSSTDSLGINLIRLSVEQIKGSITISDSYVYQIQFKGDI